MPPLFVTPPTPVTVLPQQRLLLQLVVMSGDIAVTNVAPQCILRRTLRECEHRGWVEVTEISPGVHKVILRPPGRVIAHADEGIPDQPLRGGAG
ncbi:hypothetical protein [Roseospira visakhapatnamensis]|uniref:6-phosphogluconolactonase (Cycloisomerase 2 family) n=1 Tax=Roseospira visakhapatnamensis TaxID=390880 RepID=A0A7W6RA85_9PROT|nr:hypothetical protein [Roseospira visakhapatnamensis]MBB4264690.1 6-phosphogluconolactonase (cycloisomerase 2 family) [Roseospira visakhapatnamensis]